MTTPKRPTSAEVAREHIAAKAAARASSSGPAVAPPSDIDDALAQQVADTEATVAAIPYNADKAAEHGHDNALAPPEGTHVQPLSDLVGASTLAETNSSKKTGRPAVPGTNPTTDPLERVRVDATGQRLTTNQGVAIADNQNSLKAGLRGPALLKDF